MNELDSRVGERRDPASGIAGPSYRHGSRAAAITPTFARSDLAARDCYIVIGNHLSYVGIGEILFTLMTYFSRRHRVHVSESIVPNAINIIIDEFSTTAKADYIKRTRENHPKTRYILMATEFITEISFLGLVFGKTFNFFDPWEDCSQIADLLAYRLRLRPRQPYMCTRYLGFVRALGVADLVLCAHPLIPATMRLLPGGCAQPRVPPLTLYPEIDCESLINDRRLYRLPAGVVMTGTLTPFRKRIVMRMLKTFHRAGIYTPFYQHITFDQSPGPQFDGVGVDLGYDEPEQSDAEPRQAPQAVKNFLYNLNPPQRANWPYSSPMRILRAILRGQIPVVTRKFNDHDIESVAVEWDDRAATADKMWVDATMGRLELVERHLAAVASYNRTAQQKNAEIDSALANLQ